MSFLLPARMTKKYRIYIAKNICHFSTMHHLPVRKIKRFCELNSLKSKHSNQGCKSLLSSGGDNFQFYPNFALSSTLGGMNLDHHFFQVSKFSEEQKKGLHQKWNTFFPRKQVKTKKKDFTKNGTRRVAKNSQWGGG